MSLRPSYTQTSNILFFLPLIYMFSLSYLTYLNLTANTELFGYYAYLQFFDLWRSFKPFILIPLLAKIFFFSDYDHKLKICSAVALGGIFFVCRSFYPNYFLLYAVALCLAAKSVSYRSIAKTYLLCAGATLVSTLILLVYGLVEDNVITRGSMVRHSLGLVHPNSLGMWGLLLLVYYIQYRQASLSTKDLVILVSSIAVFFLVTGSRASMILSVLVLLLTILFYMIRSERITKTLLILIFFGILLTIFIWFFIIAVYNKENPVFLLMDKLTSGRIHLSKRALSDYPLALFGHNISFSYHVDPLFTYSLVIYGLFGLVVFQSLFDVGAFRVFRKNLPYILIAMLAFQLYNTQENVFLYHLLDLTMFSATCDINNLS